MGYTTATRKALVTQAIVTKESTLMRRCPQVGSATSTLIVMEKTTSIIEHRLRSTTSSFTQPQRHRYGMYPQKKMFQMQSLKNKLQRVFSQIR
jgi:hypothetical protein